MRLLGGVLGAMLLATVLWDAFETIILPRRVSGRIRLTRLFYRSTWIPWRAAARALSGRKRDVFLSIFGPLSLILLLALWAVGSVFSFGLLQWAAGSAMRVVGDGGGGAPGFWSDVYMSGTTFFTLGLGDVVPRTALAKTLTVIEAGTGFAFLAAVIGYFPVIYQAFSRREVAISLLDARAGVAAVPAHSPSCCATGSAGPPTCSRVTSLIPRSPISGRSTTTSRGSRRSPPSSTRARS